MPVPLLYGITLWLVTTLPSLVAIGVVLGIKQDHMFKGSGDYYDRSPIR